jgi:hypothetical protein
MVSHMKAITLWQPWASLVAIGAKKIETRSWYTNYRGPLAIHASKRFLLDARMLCWSEPFLSALEPAGWNPELFPQKVLPLGAIVAVCNLVECCRIYTESYKTRAPGLYTFHGWLPKPAGYPVMKYYASLPEEPELAFGDYTPGRYAWILGDVRQIEPIPCRGKQRLWDVPQGVEEVIRCR